MIVSWCEYMGSLGVAKIQVYSDTSELEDPMLSSSETGEKASPGMKEFTKINKLKLQDSPDRHHDDHHDWEDWECVSWHVHDEEVLGDLFDWTQGEVPWPLVPQVGRVCLVLPVGLGRGNGRRVGRIACKFKCQKSIISQSLSKFKQGQHRENLAHKYF